MADAASPDTPTDPRQAANQIAMRTAGTFAKSVEPELRVSKLYALNIATKVVDALADAGLLSLSGDSIQTTDGVDPDVLAVLEYVSGGRGYVDVEPYPDFEARRALGRLHDEAASRGASGTPAQTGEEA